MKSASILSNGRAVIPVALREQLGLRDGDRLIWSAREGELIATTRRAQLRKAQAMFQKYVPANSPSLADELIAERRAASETE
jgi:bifunctional DNA-binding transcriptional regulator/antitoxin component of YhaV-PrlF toxin-antitoxin module